MREEYLYLYLMCTALLVGYSFGFIVPQNYREKTLLAPLRSLDKPTDSTDVDELKGTLIAACDVYMANLQTQWEKDDSAGGVAVQRVPKREGFFGASSFKDEQLTGSNSETIIALINQLAQLNPTMDPF
jgi:hypothetical protein